MGTDNNYPEIRLGSTTGNNIAIATAAGSFPTSAAVNDMVIRSINRLILQSGGGNAAFLITRDNIIGIGTSSNINNILQVGDGARLKISNGPNDYTIIGSKDVDDSANTCIYINGNTRFAGNAEKIEYYATTTTGDHTFYTNRSSTLTNTLANFAPDKIRWVSSPACTRVGPAGPAQVRCRSTWAPFVNRLITAHGLHRASLSSARWT
jgi:hypothetical protein